MDKKLENLSVTVMVEHDDSTTIDADTSYPAMRKIVFFMHKDVLIVRNICPDVSIGYTNDMTIDTHHKCNLMSFINNIVTILNSSHANAFLSDLALAYPEGYGLVSFVPDRNNDLIDIRHGFVLGWEKDASTFKFLSLRNKDEIDDETSPDQEYAVYAMALIFSYIVLSYKLLPSMYDTARDITEKYLRKLDGGL